MPYRVKAVFRTIQGEGVNAGRLAVLIRFAGCNLWSGREEDRATARCRFCDTDFTGTDGPGGSTYGDADSLAAAAAACWPGPPDPRTPGLAVCTGGEPLLQLDACLVDALHARGFRVAVETNGTLPAPPGLDWVCVSPKAGVPLVLERGDELKLVYPQPAAEPERFEDLAFGAFVLQPMDGPEAGRNTRLALEYCLEHPRWRLGIQVHKLLGIP